MFSSNSISPRRFFRALCVRTFTLLITIVVGALNVTTNANQTPGDSAADISEKVEVVEQIAFTPCPENPQLECGKLNLPVDYSKPHGEKFAMAVIRARATDPARRIGVLFGNPGGPGSSGVDFVLGGVGAPIFERLRERFDMISFDVGGTHRSRAVRCDLPPAGIPTNLDDPALAQFFDEFSSRVAKACLEQNGPFILSLSGNNMARDMDLLRRALKESQITYAGLSYGTIMGSVYASLFPHRVRAMLLDGGFAPEFLDQRVEFRSEQGLSFEFVLHRLNQLCSKDASCRLKDTGVLTAFDEVAQQLRSQPLPLPGGLTLDDADLQRIISALLSIESLWPFIVDALADARVGNYTLLKLLLPFNGDFSLLTTPSFDAFTAIQCNDYGTRRSAAEYLPVDEVIGTMAPRIEGRFKIAAATAVCASWPKPEDPPIIRNVKKKLKHPIMLMGNDFDPNTPLSWTRRLARALGMETSITRYQGGGHLAYIVLGNRCIESAGDAYLFDLTLPPEGFACPAQPIPFRPQPALRDGSRSILERYLKQRPAIH